jgi:hypothetical protein
MTNQLSKNNKDNDCDRKGRVNAVFVEMVTREKCPCFCSGTNKKKIEEKKRARTFKNKKKKPGFPSKKTCPYLHNQWE